MKLWYVVQEKDLRTVTNNNSSSSFSTPQLGRRVRGSHLDLDTS
jgi:hypothetical protein